MLAFYYLERMGNNHVTSAPLRPGTKVRLDDGSIAHATPDRRVGFEWDGTYRTIQGNPTTGGLRYDTGWRRDQLEVVS